MSKSRAVGRLNSRQHDLLENYRKIIKAIKEVAEANQQPTLDKIDSATTVPERTQQDVESDELRLVLEKESRLFAENFNFHDSHGRASVGRAIHVVCLMGDACATDHLLERKASPNEPFETMSYDQRATLTPMHLAAGGYDQQCVAEVECSQSVCKSRCKNIHPGPRRSLSSLCRADSITSTDDPGRSNHVATLRALLDHRGDVNILSTHAGRDHYTPLHEAAYSANLDTTEFLLKHRADVNKGNLKDQTALHVAAKAGKSWEVVKALVDGKADLAKKDTPGRRDHCPEPQTALNYAIASQFPNDKLHLLTRKCIEDLKIVAAKNPRAAQELIASEADKEAWRHGLLHGDFCDKRPCWEDLVLLLGMAPRVATALLDVLSVEPPCEFEYEHSLPHVLPRFFRTKTLRCEYVPDTTWTFDPKKQGVDTYPLWHDRLASYQLSIQRKPRFVEDPSFRLKDLQHELNIYTTRGQCGVQIKMLRLPNVLTLEVFMALSETACTSVFSTYAAQAIVDFTWVRIVRAHYFVQFMVRVTELVALAVVAVAAHDVHYAQRLSWSWMCATSLREIITEIYQVHGYLVKRRIGGYLGDAQNYVDLISTMLLAILVWDSANTLLLNADGRRTLLSLVSFSRWVTFLYMMRAFTFKQLGYNILPLFQSFFEVSGIFVIAFVVFVAFCHMFAIIDAQNTLDDWSNLGTIMLGTFKILLMGEGDGIDFVLALGGKGKDGDMFTQWLMYFATVVFCVCVLNLFIAVHGTSYEVANSMVKECFYYSRAKICLTALMQPAWTLQYPRHRHRYVCYVFLLLVSLLVWACSVCLLPQVHPVFASIFLVVCLHIGDRLLLRRPWRYVRHNGIHPARDSDDSHLCASQTLCSLRTDGSKEDLYLWWCTWEEEEDSWGRDVEDSHSVPSRGVAKGNDFARRCVRERLDSMTPSLIAMGERVRCFSQRLQQLELKLDNEEIQHKTGEEQVMEQVNALNQRLQQVEQKLDEQKAKDEEFREQVLRLLLRSADAARDQQNVVPQPVTAERPIDAELNAEEAARKMLLPHPTEKPLDVGEPVCVPTPPSSLAPVVFDGAETDGVPVPPPSVPLVASRTDTFPELLT